MSPGYKRNHLGLIASLTVVIQLLLVASTKAEDGYRLWLRYEALPKQMIAAYGPHVSSVVASGKSASLEAIRSELVEGCSGLLGGPVALAQQVDRDGAVVVGTPGSSSLIANLKWQRQLADLGPEGFRIRSLKLGGYSVTIIASNGEVGALYGAFHFLRLMQTLQRIDNLDVNEKPRLQLRVLDHWDNLDGTIERGYAGRLVTQVSRCGTGRRCLRK